MKCEKYIILNIAREIENIILKEYKGVIYFEIYSPFTHDDEYRELFTYIKSDAHKYDLSHTWSDIPIVAIKYNFGFPSKNNWVFLELNENELTQCDLNLNKKIENVIARLNHSNKEMEKLIHGNN